MVTAEQGKSEIYFRPPAKVMVIDDSELNLSFISNSFVPPNYHLFTSKSAQEGIALTKAEKPELILLDIMMPEMDGYEVAKLLKADPELAEIPIIFITALDALKDKLKAFESGAVDFVTKPFNHKELIARVRTHIELRRAIEEKKDMLKIAMTERHSSAIARIAAGISHNFNNMLGVSFGNIMLVESILGNISDPTAREALSDIKKSLSRMQTMVKQFLVLAKRSGELKNGLPAGSLLNLKSLVDEVIINLKLQKSNAPVPLEVLCVNQIDPAIDVFFDPGHLSEIFHLIINEVVDTTLGKAEITLKTDTEATEGNCKCILDVRKIQHTSATEDTVFEPFGLPIANVGSGLSFCVAKHLIELNEGSISAKFPEKDEIIFTITFS